MGKRSLKDYKVGRLIGKGGFGKVYEVRYVNGTSNAKYYAMKVIKKKQSLIERVRNEIEIQKSLEHIGIVKLYHYFEDSENIYMIMEKCSANVYEHLKNKGYLSDQETAALLYQLIEALDYLHSRGVMHRDLKMSNLLLSENGDLKISDFGLATYTNKKHYTICGTPNYIAPEVSDEIPYDEHADIWSVGCVMYYFLTGEPPFESESISETILKAKDADYDIPGHISDVSTDLLMKLLKTDPASRPSLQQIKKHLFFSCLNTNYIDKNVYMSSTAIERSEKQVRIHSTSTTSNTPSTTTSTSNKNNRKKMNRMSNSTNTPILVNTQKKYYRVDEPLLPIKDVDNHHHQTSTNIIIPTENNNNETRNTITSFTGTSYSSNSSVITSRIKYFDNHVSELHDKDLKNYEVKGNTSSDVQNELNLNLNNTTRNDDNMDSISIRNEFESLEDEEWAFFYNSNYNNSNSNIIEDSCLNADSTTGTRSFAGGSIIDPLNTRGLKACDITPTTWGNYLISTSGSIIGTFNKFEKGTSIQFSVSSDGYHITVMNVADDSTNSNNVNNNNNTASTIIHDGKPFEYNLVFNFPDKYSIFYSCLRTVIEELRSKTPKVICTTSKGKGILMQNEPLPNYIHYFNNKPLVIEISLKDNCALITRVSPENEISQPAQQHTTSSITSTSGIAICEESITRPSSAQHSEEGRIEISHLLDHQELKVCLLHVDAYQRGDDLYHNTGTSPTSTNSTCCNGLCTKNNKVPLSLLDDVHEAQLGLQMCLAEDLNYLLSTPYSFTSHDNNNVANVDDFNLSGFPIEIDFSDASTRRDNSNTNNDNTISSKTNIETLLNKSPLSYHQNVGDVYNNNNTTEGKTRKYKYGGNCNVGKYERNQLSSDSTSSSSRSKTIGAHNPESYHTITSYNNNNNNNNNNHKIIIESAAKQPTNEVKLKFISPMSIERGRNESREDVVYIASKDHLTSSKRDCDILSYNELSGGGDLLPRNDRGTSISNTNVPLRKTQHATFNDHTSITLLEEFHPKEINNDRSNSSIIITYVSLDGSMKRLTDVDINEIILSLKNGDSSDEITKTMLSSYTSEIQTKLINMAAHIISTQMNENSLRDKN